MGAASYNRGSRLVAQEAEERASALSGRADRQAYKDEADRLRAEIARLQRDLRRARRCLAAERYAREKRVAELNSELRLYQSSVEILCRLAFPGDKP